MSQKAKRVKITAAELKAKKADPKFVEMTNNLLDSGVLSDDDGAIVKYARKRIYGDRKALKAAKKKAVEPKEKTYAWAAEHRKVQVAPKSTGAYDDSTSALAAFKKRGTRRKSAAKAKITVKYASPPPSDSDSDLEDVVLPPLDIDGAAAELAACTMEISN